MKRKTAGKAADKVPAVVGKLAKARGCTPAEVRLDAAQAIARANAARCAELERQLADTTREAAADIAALAQQVTTAQMWTRYERRKRKRTRIECDTLREALALVGAHGAKPKRTSRAAVCTSSRAAEAVAGAWAEYRRECGGRRQPTLRGFLDEHANDEIITTRGVRYCLYDPGDGSGLVKNEAELKLVLNRVRVNADNAAKRGNAKPTQTRKRK